MVVVGTVRNIEKSLMKKVAKINSVLNNLGSVKFLLIESDSNDNTVKVLERARLSNENFAYKSLGNLSLEIPDRIERLIHCRNVYHAEIVSSQSYSECDFVVVVDLDNALHKLSTASVSKSINNKEPWAALFSNQTHKYYDLLALRHPQWCPSNVFEEYLWLRRFMSARKAKSTAIFNRMIKIPITEPMIPVDSAFGGFAIYKMQYFRAGSYLRSNLDSPSDIDHVIFNRRILETGGKLFIDPQLINTSWTAHSLSSHSWFRFVARLKSKLDKVLPPL